jgi:long-chain acyl-CoA synthetase
VNLATVLTETSARMPDRVALRLGEATLSYRELDDASARVAALLAAHSVGVGDRVGVMLPNVAEFAVVYFGVLRAGAVVVPLNPLLKAREVAYHLTDSEARLIFAWHASADEATQGVSTLGAAVVEVDPSTFVAALTSHRPSSEVVDRTFGDTAVILYTSGTTGRPKGAELTHGSLLRNAEVVQSDLVNLEPDDVVFGGLPLFHSFGQTCTLNVAMAAGATLALLPRFDARTAVNVLATTRATVFAGVPTMYSAFLALPDPPALPDLRVCISGGAALPVEVLHRFEERFGCQVLEGYGLSETSPVASFNRLDRDRKPGSIGTPVTGVEMRVVDKAGRPVGTGEVGEIAIRGHNVMKGYWRKPDETAEVLGADGWFRTGDIGKVDADGYFFIVDRKKDLVIRGGFNVYPREIEEVLYEHPAVAEAAVVGIPHAELGEEVAAVITLKPGTVATEDELRSFVKRQVAPYKYPRVVRIVHVLPTGPTGKILKTEIRSSLASQQTDDVR